ncbi:MarR family winged helix-turn-helix transcriptional regulator [Sneathiella sp. HT1-7]|uniref:MarR family winged helix-turn-helix transcriptional regulator n=1 Tax=Sneathiella sp. HT1-7 TaxID=2887192 RepID=UPI001D13B72D|nr:MarR family transcriptional regulator [Sneathiella sp. HT1-7]MCC3304179.1 MarR family transcriptional regulator [Sneathiella sp. HT1-7]
MLSKTDNTLGTLVHEVAHLLRTHIDRRVEPYNLTRAKWLALGVLDRRDGITQTELADYLELDKSTIGRLLDRLEERGFIRREKDPNDRRVFRIFIAKTAYPVLTELEQVADGVRAQALSGISEEDNEKLLALLGQVKKNLIAAREGS